ncbi:hypothetical protein N7471_010484 [Penicillium samsonianum]|uniref:uncharacterized protein n=1 Tax=Penicillium samsonianum TaxID=1882272 RepID=UPI0025496A33|nr:uncharacterized protein N7471_010484 [Penicillium samsonianum]KAJ6125991.1 hypothetical protein N7471_010484 [Penicillium samsonianum]
MKTSTGAKSLLGYLNIIHAFIPGFTKMARLLHRLLNVKGKSLTYLVYLIGSLAVMRPYAVNMTSWLQNYFTSTVHIHSSSETHDMLTSWIASRGLEDAARSFIAKVNTTRRNYGDRSRAVKKPLQFLPYNAGFFIWFKKQPLLCKINEEGTGYSKYENISVTCLGRSSNILKALLKECQDEYLNHIENKITIFGHCSSQWRKEKAKDIRPLSTVILKDSEKSPLIKDMKDFLEPQTRNWYSQRRLPYRRGYLLHGPPGTGKSSFSLSIAGELGMDIYAVSIPSVDDQSLKTLFEQLPDNCVVLLEDIDAVGSVYSRELGADGPNSDSKSHAEKNGVTLSGLLNVLDGVAAQEARVVIMTTNHIKKLDPALIRPGRVDKKVEFQLADRDVAMQLHRFIFDQPIAPSSESTPQAKVDPSTERHAIEFARKVPEGEFSPAQIMSYLVQHRHEPGVALDNVQRWIEAMREETKKAKASTTTTTF